MALRTSDFQFELWITSDRVQLRRRGESISNLAREFQVARATLHDALKLMERQRERRPERRPRAPAAAHTQAGAARRVSVQFR